MKYLLITLSLLFGMNTYAQYGIGDKASNFTLKSTSGKMVSLDDYQGVAIVFTCNTCPYAQMYEERIMDIHNKYASKGYPVLAINPNDPSIKEGDSFDNMVKLANEMNYPFEYVMDEKQTVYPAFGATKTPHVFLLDKDHVVRYIGAVDDNAQSKEAVEEAYLANAIEALLAGKTPSPDKTKEIGCSIKGK